MPSPYSHRVPAHFRPLPFAHRLDALLKLIIAPQLIIILDLHQVISGSNATTAN